MSALDMMGTVDQHFQTGVVTITATVGDYVDGEWVEAVPAPTPTQHLATKQVANAEELSFLSAGGERYKDVARFFINDGSVHSVGVTLVDAHDNEYRIVDADCRPERNYCRLLGASKNE